MLCQFTLVFMSQNTKMQIASAVSPFQSRIWQNLFFILVNKGYKSASIQTNVSALGYCHNILGLPNPANKFLITKLLAGAKRLAPSQDKRLPVTLHMLHNFIQIIKRLYPVVYERRMYTAMFLFAFHAFF